MRDPSRLKGYHKRAVKVLSTVQDASRANVDFQLWCADILGTEAVFDERLDVALERARRWAGEPSDRRISARFSETARERRVRINAAHAAGRAQALEAVLAVGEHADKA